MRLFYSDKNRHVNSPNALVILEKGFEYFFIKY